MNETNFCSREPCSCLQSFETSCPKAAPTNDSVALTQWFNCDALVTPPPGGYMAPFPTESGMNGQGESYRFEWLSRDGSQLLDFNGETFVLGIPYNGPGNHS